jgi:hypothetical protein
MIYRAENAQARAGCRAVNAAAWHSFLEPSHGLRESAKDSPCQR